jgi:hypothetical protein
VTAQSLLDAIDQILDRYDQLHGMDDRRAGARSAVIRLMLRERLDELETAGAHFCDKPVNFVHYNERVAAIKAQLVEAGGKA